MWVVESVVAALDKVAVVFEEIRGKLDTLNGFKGL